MHLVSRRSFTTAQPATQSSIPTPLEDIQIDQPPQEARVFNPVSSRAGRVNTAGTTLTPEPETSLQQD